MTGIDPKEGTGTWYRDIGGGMGQALNAASAMPAYTLSDRGTWLSFGNKGPLVVAVEGDPKLIISSASKRPFPYAMPAGS